MKFMNYIPKSCRKTIILDKYRSWLFRNEIMQFKEEAKSCKIKVGTIFCGNTLKLALFGANQHVKNKQKLLSKQLTI